MALLCSLLNGQAASRISLQDRGLLYADGLFETIAVVKSSACHEQAHLHRMRLGSERLGINCPADEAWLQDMAQLLEQQKKPKAVIKLILTRGSSGRGYLADAGAAVTRIALLYDWPDYPAHHWTEGIRIRYCQTPLSMNPVLAGIKHLNRLEQVLARQEWQTPEIIEGLMLNTRGQVIEGIISNIFLLSGQQLLTPLLEQCGVRGVMRELIMQHAEKWGYQVQEKIITPHDIEKARALFVSNSLIGLWPVRQIDDHFKVLQAHHLNLADQARKLALSLC
ncbi:MAG: aminodeoxychorismate lyase [gamma proteobacterium symbiont of Bathyaustriella thionipta]|nr:aminodeoxychorismate lyase [gamma proteobacterium symbiont of Bathyaustriella thionipta]